MQPFSVRVEDANRFASVWNYKGLVIPMQDAHLQFATDYANIVLRGFVEMIQAQAAAKKEQAEKASTPLVQLT